MEKLKSVSRDITNEVFEGRKEAVLYLTKDDLFSETRYVFAMPSEFFSFEVLQSEIEKLEEFVGLIVELIKKISMGEVQRLLEVMEKMIVEI